jgi:hypothetical protein
LPGNFAGATLLSETSPPVAMVLETTVHDEIASIATVAASAICQIPNGFKNVLPMLRAGAVLLHRWSVSSSQHTDCRTHHFGNSTVRRYSSLSPTV